MKVTYDRESDAAYIYLTPASAEQSASSTYACDPAEVNGQIQLDFNKDGQLIGIEVLDASRLLAEEFLLGSE